MPTNLVAAKEEETYIIGYSPKDHLKQAVTPVTLTWSLMDLDGNPVNGRTDVVVPPAGTTSHIIMTGDDLALDVDGQRVRRILLIKATYNAEIDEKPYVGLPIYIEARFDIEPVEGV